jgi:Nuclease-related domain
MSHDLQKISPYFPWLPFFAKFSMRHGTILDKTGRGTAVSQSAFEWEREALDFLRQHLPDHDPWRAWSNFEFIDDEGRVNEVDVLVLTPVGLVLIEVKSRPGTLRGDAYGDSASITIAEAPAAPLLKNARLAPSHKRYRAQAQSAKKRSVMDPQP